MVFTLSASVPFVSLTISPLSVSLYHVIQVAVSEV